MIDVLSEFKEDVEYDFSNGLHVGLHDEEMIDAYLDLGVKTLKFSVETGTEFSMKKADSVRIIGFYCNFYTMMSNFFR